MCVFEGGGTVYMFPLELSILPSLLFSSSWSVVDLCAKHNLLQAGASHMKDERCGYNDNSLGVGLTIQQ